MGSKLTLRLDEELIANAKKEARKRGTSLSQMVADYFRGIRSSETPGQGMPPVTASLMGVLRGKGGKSSEDLDRTQYRQHLEKKHQ